MRLPELLIALAVLIFASASAARSDTPHRITVP